jgi:hypothetical protein
VNRPQRNRNPGNLKFVGQSQALGADLDGFAIFATDQDGWRALVRQIQLDQSRDMTLFQFCVKYCPTDVDYVHFMARELGVHQDVKLREINPWTIAVHIARKEGWFAEEKS